MTSSALKLRTEDEGNGAENQAKLKDRKSERKTLSLSMLKDRKSQPYARVFRQSYFEMDVDQRRRHVEGDMFRPASVVFVFITRSVRRQKRRGVSFGRRPQILFPAVTVLQNDPNDGDLDLRTTSWEFYRTRRCWFGQ